AREAAMARTKVVVDPISRIEGHLRIEAQAENGMIAKAWASSTQFRGIEMILQGRDPRDAWAFTQRICGVCTVVHAVATGVHQIRERRKQLPVIPSTEKKEVGGGHGHD
ncbi:MAG TPA: nickel-dependent hydrogenase large subunit, partial [Gemmatimonadales bacterium]|nr:nickel-dependent hydrogenase large subunit [Gemmatimonadales bacterium]